MKKKLGPLPVWGWGAAVALGILIFYWQRKNSGTLQSAVNPSPVLDPTQGSFPLPSGLASGGTAGEVPQAQYPTLGQELEDITNLAGGLGALYAANPYAPAAVASPEPSVGSLTLDSVPTIIQQLRDIGIIPAPPVASTGAATSKPQAHTTPKKTVERTNTKKTSPRAGLTYRVVTNPKGHLAGVYHVYNIKGQKKFVRVSKPKHHK